MASRRNHDRARRRQALLHPPVDEARRRDETPSLTAISIEALRSGVMPLRGMRRREFIPHEDDLMRVGDPDDNGLGNEYVGDETPGGSACTPDQNLIDETGRAYGLQEEDEGELRAAGEVLARRDRSRFELRPPRRRPIE